jgi:hypothetical protein
MFVYKNALLGESMARLRVSGTAVSLQLLTNKNQPTRNLSR